MLKAPTRVVVTGAAGFIGSHLCERLLGDGHEVIGIDSFSDYYERDRKEQNLETLRRDGRFTLEELDLVAADLSKPLRGAKVVFHLAGQPGVRPSWGGHFDRYVQDNIVATQRLLEALREVAVERLVFASSSSVYGDAEMFPTKETALPRPASPRPRCATSPCMDRASGPIWPSSGSWTPWSRAMRSRSTATASRRASSHSCRTPWMEPSKPHRRTWSARSSTWVAAAV